MVIADVLLGSKFYVPRWRPGLVPRPRLLERIDHGAESKLLLVSAPAGFGKTTLLAEWVAGMAIAGRRIAWLSLDRSDNHPRSFWTYLITALQTVQPAIGASIIAVLEAPGSPSMESLLPALLNEVGALAHEFVLVLDDYHLIDDTTIHEGIAFLLEHLPEQMHLVLAGRADPALPLARLRARGELVEIRAADLRFSPDEAVAFLNGAMGLELPAQDVAVLGTRTEGWIAGLQLAALSMQRRDDVAGFIAGFAGDDRYIVDYLVEEVLQQQPDATRRFLLQTSILDRLSGPLCDAVTGDEGARGMLEGLERANLFVVPLDDRRQWYRYHHLFADVLQAHLVEEQSDEVGTLHMRASAWFEHNAQPADAIRHALAANDLARAAGLMEFEAELTVRRHQPDRLIEWVQAIPDEMIRSMPVLSTYYSLALMGVGEMEAAASHLGDAERRLADPTAGMVIVDEQGFHSLPSRIALSRGYLTMAAGDAASTMEQARRGLDLLPDDEHHWRGAASMLLALAHWARGELEPAQRFHADGLASLERAGDIVLALSAAYHEGDLLKARGQLVEARRMYERALQVAVEHGDAAMPGVANLHFGLSELYCEQGDLGRAREHLERGEGLGNSAALPATPYRRCLAQARLLRSLGDLAGTLDALDQAERLYVHGATPDVSPVAAVKARVWIAQGRLDEVLGWAEAQRLSVDDELSYSREFQHLTLARLRIAQSTREQDDHPLHEAGPLLERLRAAAEAGGRTAAVIEILLLQAIVQRGSGHVAAGLAPLELALMLAEPEGYVRLFVEEGEPMRDLLLHAAAAGIGGRYTRTLLVAFETEPNVVPAPSHVAGAGLAEPLTARELEILRLIAAGLMNQEIADQLVISVSTVKRHIANGYGKLSVTHRTEAVARANELNLL